MRSEYIDEGTINAIRKNLTPHEWLSLWIAYEGGLRVGDVVALPRDCFDGKHLNFIASKTGKKGRFRPSDALCAAISSVATSSVWLFPSPRDQRRHLTRQAVWHRVKRACRSAGIDSRGVSPHSFRKAFAVKMFARNGFEQTQEALQHERAQTTELYALSDFTSGENAALPLLRRDITKIADIVWALLRPLHRETLK